MWYDNWPSAMISISAGLRLASGVYYPSSGEADGSSDASSMPRVKGRPLHGT